jgi:hypothetical protein
MATHLPVIGGHAEGFGKTFRTDSWRRGPLVTFLVFATFVVYTTWAALQGNHYYVEPYLSPFYSPVLFTTPEAMGIVGAAPESHAWFGYFPSWWPAAIPLSPAILILVFPGGFRFTCYYYRKAYYRSFAGSPPGCAVGPLAGKRKYRGETALLLIQNLHRYFLYFALVVLGFLWWDSARAFFFEAEGGGLELGVGVGTLVLFANVVALTGFTLGCNSARHLAGGKLDCFSCSRAARIRGRLWHRLTPLNIRHAEWAWISLATVGLADLYVRLAAAGVFDDPRIF